MNSFFAVSLDIDNQREHIIYCSDGGIEAFNTNQTDNVFKIERPLGEFIFDFSGLQEQERYNAVTEYLSNFPEHNAAHILTEKFFEAQRHLSFLPLKNDKNRFSTYEVLKICSPEAICKTEYDLRAFYVGDKLYIATEYDFVSLFRYYLDELYAAHLFSHKCNSCGSLFLSDKMRGGYVPEKFRTRSICLMAVSKFKSNAAYIPSEYLNDEDIIAEIIKAPESRKYIPINYWTKDKIIATLKIDKQSKYSDSFGLNGFPKECFSYNLYLEFIKAKLINPQDSMTANNSAVIASNGKISEIPAEMWTELHHSPTETFESKRKFCVYDDIKQKLVAKGIPEKEIAFIHDADTTEEKQKLFAKMNKGELRVLIGSTQKCGAGMNARVTRL